MSQQFYDHFAEANKSLAERLGSSRVTINRDSAVIGTQTRSFVQMLNYGNDMVTARAASHLLNLDLLHANPAYLMKLCEGLLLNSIASIVPPHLPFGKSFQFESAQKYGKYSIVGTCSLLDGTPCNLIIYRDPELADDIEHPAAPDMQRYKALYCAGAYVHQSVPITALDFTPGTVQSVYVSEQYKSIWMDSVEAQLTLDDGKIIKLECFNSFDSLITASEDSIANAVLVQHTARGLTITLGDGEVFGQAYNRAYTGESKVTGVTISYIKCESLADVNAASVAFNGDISPIGEIPLLSKSKPGDTAESLRLRAINEFVAAGKITQERDMETELRKIPIVKSAHCKREYNYPLGVFSGSLDSLKKAIPEWASAETYTAGALVRANAPQGYPYPEYAYYCCGDSNPGNNPASSRLWVPMFPIAAQYVAAINSLLSKYPTYQVYDNATLVVTGLVLRSRHYYREDKAYQAGDIVYYSKTNKLYKALYSNYGIAPDSDPGEPSFPWADASDLPHDPGFDAYEEITQDIFELELKHYFGIWEKLGFLSVVVEPLRPVYCEAICSYSSPYPIGSEITEAIADAICWRVGEKVSAEALNSALTDKFNLAAVSVTVSYTYRDTRGNYIPLPNNAPGYNQYVRRSALTVTLKEIQ